MGRTVIRSEFEEQRKNRQLTFLFLFLGIIWVAGLGYWTVLAHASLFAAALMITTETLPVWYTDAQVLEWSLMGVPCAVALWLLLSWILYLRSNDALPKIIGATAAQAADDARLQRMLSRVLRASGESSSPKLYVWKSGGPNAFAAGRSPAHGSIVVTRSLLATLTNDELEAVLAHELAHLKHHDSLVMVQAVALAAMIVMMGYLAAGLVGLVVLIFSVALFLAVSLIGEAAGGEGGWIVLLLGVMGIIYLLFLGLALVLTIVAILGSVILVVGLGIRIVASSLAQSREFLADAWSAAWTGRAELMASVLQKVAVTKDEPSNVKEALLQPLMLRDRRSGVQRNTVAGWLGLVLRTHPSPERRIAVLKEMAGGAGIGLSTGSSAFRYSVVESWGWLLAVCVTIAFVAGTVHSSTNVASSIAILLAKKPASHEILNPSRNGEGDIQFVAEAVVRLRSAPSTQGRIVAKLARCTAVEVLEVQKSRQGSEEWVRVRVRSAPHLQGWIAKRLLSGASSGMPESRKINSGGGRLTC